MRDGEGKSVFDAIEIFAPQVRIYQRRHSQIEKRNGKRAPASAARRAITIDRLIH
jgi:hypothetical protein